MLFVTERKWEFGYATVNNSILCMRIWRNWQTRMVQVHVLARAWRFKSSYPHHAGAKFVLLRLIFLKNKPCIRSLAALLSQKGTFPTAIRL